jgi:hypothetical protein
MARRNSGLEKRSEPLLPAHLFAIRLFFNTLGVLTLLAAVLAIGVAGYAYFEGMSLIEAYANAAMILSGMGPLTPLKTDAGRLFAGTYALVAGITFVFAAAMLLSPVAHRILHRFHLDEDIED